MSMIRLYESNDIANAYVKYRPTYTEEIVDRIMIYLKNKLKNGEKFDLMVDIGCGTGQSCFIFQPFFKKIIGFDVSKEQLKFAKEQNKFDNITFEEGSANEIPVENASVDLIVSGMAAHWFDMSKFVPEVKRVLKPNGCMALFGYNVDKVSSVDSDNEALAKETGIKLNKFLLLGLPEDPVERFACLGVARKYSKIFDAVNLTHKERDDTIHHVLDCTFDEFSGMFRSTNCYEYYMEKRIAELKKKKPDYDQKDIDAIDMAGLFCDELKTIWSLENIPRNKKILRLDFHYFLLLFSC